MSFVSESVIDEVIERMEVGELVPEKAIAQLNLEQPVIVAYLFSENFDLLTTEEKDYLFYLTMIAWLSIRQSRDNLPKVTENQLGEQEEDNWTLLQAAPSGNFSTKLDVFFENYPQEDLLAFVEDALSDVEDGPLSPEGRELVFIALKTIIDCLTDSKDS